MIKANFVSQMQTGYSTVTVWLIN